MNQCGDATISAAWMLHYWYFMRWTVDYRFSRVRPNGIEIKCWCNSCKWLKFKVEKINFKISQLLNKKSKKLKLKSENAKKTICERDWGNCISPIQIQQNGTSSIPYIIDSV